MSGTRFNEQCLLESGTRFNEQCLGVTVKKGLPSYGFNQQTVVRFSQNDHLSSQSVKWKD